MRLLVSSVIKVTGLNIVQFSEKRPVHKTNLVITSIRVANLPGKLKTKTYNYKNPQPLIRGGYYKQFSRLKNAAASYLLQ